MSAKSSGFNSRVAICLSLLCGMSRSPIALAEDVEPVARPAIERAIEGGDVVEREPLERKLEGEAAGWNLFARAIERMVRPNDPLQGEGDPLQEVDPQLRQFLPALNRVLTTEMHFLRKICNPDPEPLEQIRTAGNAQLLVVARQVAQNQHGAFRNQDKGARDVLLDALLKSAEEALPREKFEVYQAEVQRRQAFQTEGACEMMTMHVDHTLSFSVEEYDEVSRRLIQNAKPQWSSSLQTFMYRDYCPLPDSALLDPVLNERQKRIWKGKGRTTSSINFGWPRNIGIDMFGGGAEFEELDDYSSEAADE